jgi:RHS repeat-associated protein
VEASFDAYGVPRDPTTWSGAQSAADQALIAGLTRHGYTGHTMLGNSGLIHMNGRVMDASIGRFISPDPYITEPGNTQNFNRYSYVVNNPMSNVDPSGFDASPIIAGAGGNNTNYSGCDPQSLLRWWCHYPNYYNSNWSPENWNPNLAAQFLPPPSPDLALGGGAFDAGVQKCNSVGGNCIYLGALQAFGTAFRTAASSNSKTGQICTQGLDPGDPEVCGDSFEANPSPQGQLSPEGIAKTLCNYGSTTFSVYGCYGADLNRQAQSVAYKDGMKVAISIYGTEIGGEALLGSKAVAKALGPAGNIFGRTRLGGSSLFGINSNAVLRIGWGWDGTSTAGANVFRISGSWIRALGIRSGHIDLFTLAP